MTQPTPSVDAAEFLSAAKFARLQQEKIGVHFAGMKKSIAPMLAIPGDTLLEAICQPEERHKILQLRKAIGTLIEQVETHQSSLLSLCELLELSAKRIQEKQAVIDAQSLRITQLEKDQNG